MKQLVVSQGSFVHRWFNWSLDVIERFTWEDNDMKGYRDGTNLCHMMRILILYVPMIFLFELAVATGVVYALIIVPIAQMGWRTWLLDFSARVGVALTVWLIVYFCTRPKQDDGSKRDDKHELTLGRLITQSIIANKRKICPFVTFTGRSSS